jgi:hypothetical protein
VYRFAVVALLLGCEPRVTRLAAPPDPDRVDFVASSEVRRVAVGWNDLCVLMANGDVRCKQDFRPAGVRRLGSFVTVRGASGVVEIAAGHHHACARTAAGAVVCWGRNDAGEVIGDDPFVRVARSVPLPAAAVEVRVGETQSCARLASKAVYCWGAIAGAKYAPPTPIDWFADASTLGLATDATCAVIGGVLRCSFSGGKPLEPVEAVVRNVTLGRWRGCALLEDMTVRCFALSRPANAPITAKVPAWSEAVPLTDVAEVVSGITHFCARKKDKTVWCWGGNTYGQLGNGTRDGSNEPVPVKGLIDAEELAAGGDRSCARRAAGMVVCWGADLLGDAMFRALTGLYVEPGPPGPNDSLRPEELRVPVEYSK